jgi:death-on-curing protein
LLESALARPRQLLAYGDPPPSLQQLAAAYGYSLARDHCFADGNKRVALAVVDVFLALNGLQLQAPEPAAVEIFRSLAAGEISEAEFARWITDNTRGDGQP